MTTFYVYGRGRFDSQRLGLYRLTGKPHGTRIKLSQSSPFFSYSTIVSASHLSATPEEALEKYRREVAARLDRLKTDVANTERELKKIPATPPTPTEEKQL